MKALGTLGFLSPSLSDNNAEGLFSYTMILMMISIRISLCNLALMQTRNLLKLMQSLTVDSPSTSAEAKLRIVKEIISLSDTVAATLASKRFYLRQIDAGSYEIEPRYLLFEFCHGLLLRSSQVDLVKTLVVKMESGGSICHQVRKFTVCLELNLFCA
jgi:hypothetical protein